MTKHTHIQYIYIWKKLNNSISPEENELLTKWLNESTENLQFYLSAKEFESNKSVDNTSINWLKLEKKIKQRKIKRIALYSCAATIIGVIFFITLFNNNTDTSPSLALKPGIDKATLILSDGNSYLLEDTSDFCIEERGVKIKSKKGTLVYNSQKKKNKQIAYNTIHVPRGGEFFIVLSDSTKVWINSESMLRFPTSFEKNERKIELIGEAYFEVKKDRSKPFIVVSNEQIIEVTGTAFNVSTFGPQGLILTTLVEGSVQITSQANKEITTKLVPGNQSKFDALTQSVIINDVNVSLFTSWKDGFYNFQDETIENILITLSRWYNFEYQFKNKNIKSIRFSGRIKRTDSFQRVLSFIEKTNEIHFDIIDNQVIVN